MNNRRRFQATMHYAVRDRVPLIDLGFWSECFEVWRDQGLPQWVTPQTSDRFFGMDGFMRYYLSDEATDGHTTVDRGCVLDQFLRVGLWPQFDERVIEDRGAEEIVQQGDGIRVLRSKRMGSIPQHQAHLLTSRAVWREHYLPRLDPRHPDRYPKDWERFMQIARDPDRPFMLTLPGGSFYGWLRNWLGVENISLLIYDDPAWFEEMVEAITHCVTSVLGRALEAGGQFDACLIWEDVSFNAGPLISPRHFERMLLPHYRRLTDLLERYGVNTIIVDSDGRVDDLIPLWLDVGVNCIMPVEIGTTGADPLSLRQRFGRALRMIGGVDKRILAGARDEITAEIKRLTPLVEEGGYLPTCDHKVPPDVPLANYRFFLDSIRLAWGHHVNLVPAQDIARPVGEGEGRFSDIETARD